MENDLQTEVVKSILLSYVGPLQVKSSLVYRLSHSGMSVLAFRFAVVKVSKNSTVHLRTTYIPYPG